MKKLMMMLALVLACFGTSAMAQTATNTSTPSNNTCVGNVCPGTGGVLINVQAGAGHAGDFRAMFDAGPKGTGSATAEKDGGAYSVFDIVYDNCNAGPCGEARITANVGGYEIGQSMATANTTAPGQWVTAQNTGTALTAGQLVVTMVRPNAPTSGHTQNGPGN